MVMRLLQGLMAVCFLTILPGMTVPALAGGDDAGRPLSGVLAAANGQVTAQKAGDRSAPPRRLEIGAKLFFEDEVVTAAGVQAQILLRDGTTFSIGENATLVLDEFVYDPATDNGAVGAVIKRGAFRFISGKIAKKQPSNMQVLAGNTAIAVRGTEVIGNVGGGSETVILLSGQVDLQSTAGDCGQTESQQGSDMFGIGRDGQLEFNAAISETPPAFCQQSLVRAGFGVQVAASGVISTPTRIDQDDIDAVLEATIIRRPSAAEEESDTEDTEDADSNEADAADPEKRDPDESETEDTAADETARRDDMRNDNDAADNDAADNDADNEKRLGAGESQASEDSGAVLRVRTANSFVAAEDPEKQNAADRKGTPSDFDKVVMRAFGLLDRPADDDGKDSEPVMDNAALSDLTRNDGRSDGRSDDSRKDAAADDGKANARADDGKPDAGEADADRRAGTDDILEDNMKREADAVEAGERTLADSNTESSNSGGNSAPVLAAISAVSLTDSTADDSFSNTDGNLSASDSDSGDTITYALASSTPSNAVSGFTHMRQGTYGVMLLNSATGAYRFMPSSNSIQALSSNASESYSFSASDGSLSASQSLTVNITGANDGPSTIDTAALASAGGTQNTGAAGLRVGVVTDPEGDVVTDISSALNSLPAWLSFNNQTLGNGSVEYYWEIGANTLPWLNGSASLQLQARSSGVDSSAASIAITFSCQSSNCNDFLQSADAVTSPAPDDATDINALRSTGIKINDEVFSLMSIAQRDALFDTGTAATGTFRQVYTSAETGSGSPAGSWTFNQHVSANYQTREITLTSDVSASNLTYFDGASDDFSYVSTMDYSNIQAGTTAVFEKQTNSGSASGYNLVNGSSANVDVNFLDQIGFVVDSNGVKAAIVNTAINPDNNNPFGYKDDTREMIQREWRVLEPQ